MPKLKTGGSRLSAKASSASLRRTHNTSSDPGRLLTPSKIDLAQELEGGLFAPLRDPQLFAQFRLDPNTCTIVWPNGADLAPEFVRQIMRAVTQSDSLSPEHLAAIRRAAPKAKGKIISSLI